MTNGCGKYFSFEVCDIAVKSVETLIVIESCAFLHLAYHQSVYIVAQNLDILIKSFVDLKYAVKTLPVPVKQENNIQLKGAHPPLTAAQ